MMIDATLPNRPPKGAQELIDRVASAYGAFDVSVEGAQWKIKRGGREAAVEIRQLPAQAAAEATFDRLSVLRKPTDEQRRQLDEATFALQQIAATEGLIAATIYNEILAPEQGNNLTQKLERR